MINHFKIVMAFQIIKYKSLIIPKLCGLKKQELLNIEKFCKETKTIILHFDEKKI